MTRPPYRLAAMAEKPHWGMHPSTAPAAQPHRPPPARACSMRSPWLCSMASMARHARYKKGSIFTVSMSASIKTSKNNDLPRFFFYRKSKRLVRPHGGMPNAGPKRTFRVIISNKKGRCKGCRSRRGGFFSFWRNLPAVSLGFSVFRPAFVGITTYFFQKDAILKAAKHRRYIP